MRLLDRRRGIGRETAIPLVLVFLAVPAVGMSGLSLPVPPAVERLAASLVPVGPAYTRDVELDTTAPVRRVRVTLAPEEKAARASAGTAAAPARPARVPEGVNVERRPRAEPPSRASSVAKPVRAARPEPRPAIEPPRTARTPAGSASTPSVGSAPTRRRDDRRLVDDGPAVPARVDPVPPANGPSPDGNRGRGRDEAAGGDAPRPVEPRSKPVVEHAEAPAKGKDTGRGDDGATGTVVPEPTATAHPGNGKGVGPQKSEEPGAGEPAETRNGHGKGGVNAGGDPAPAPEPAAAPEPGTATEPPADEPSTDAMAAATARPAATGTSVEQNGNGKGNGSGGKGAA